jgi:hypothetical protein
VLPDKIKPAHGLAPSLLVAYDDKGHLLLALINIKMGSFAQNVGGVAYSIGGTASPMLFFYRF